MADGSGGEPWEPEWNERPIPFFFLSRGRQPIRSCGHAMCWMIWRSEIANVRVAQSFVGRFMVSTIFLGEDMSLSMYFGGTGIFFETMTEVVGDGGGWGAQSRCSTWADAEAQHARSVKVAHELAFPERYIGQPMTHEALEVLRIGQSRG
jgi:hypothetical protein